MAEIVLGIGTSHSPMLFEPPEEWLDHGRSVDMQMKELCFPSSGEAVSYEDALARADPEITKLLEVEHYKGQHANLQKALDELAKTFREVKPDIAVVISDDQGETLFEDNMPTFSIYWGDTIHHNPRKVPEGASQSMRNYSEGYGSVDQHIPVPAELGRHMIEHMMENDFDVGHRQYMRDEFGGSIARRYPSSYGGEIDHPQIREPRNVILPHGWGYIVKRIMESKPAPMLPIFVNTCYPPNQPTSKRCFNFGREIRKAIESWDKDLRVAVMASGGLSHFVVDEELDRSALKGMVDNDAEILSNLPRHRLHSAASETLNWITAAGALEHLKAEVLAYEPVYRTPAGTGGGWAMARWNGGR